MSGRSAVRGTLRPDRRDLLRYAGVGLAGLTRLGAASAGLGGCNAARSDQPSERAWQSLADRLSGRLVRPDAAGYPAASQLFDPAFDHIRPAAVAYCAAPADVAACLAFIRSHQIGFTPRCGGHSYAGYSTSTGLVLDVTPMSAVRPADDGTATIGAGALLIDVYAELAAGGAALPAGSCPVVGIAGLALGGGIGVVGRRHGLTCDRMTAVEVVLASGEVVTVDADREPDLFWALRGGGGGNFGVVTSFTFATHRAAPLGLFTYRWPWESAGVVVAAWQEWSTGPNAPDELWSTCVLTTRPADGVDVLPSLRLTGVHTGGLLPLAALLDELVAAVPVPPSSTFRVERGHLETMLIEAGCASESVERCRLAGRDVGRHPEGVLPRVTQLAASNFVTEPLDGAGIAALLGTVEARQRTEGLGPGGVILDSWGGAIGRVAADETAFVHRDALASVQYVAGYGIDDPEPARAENERWLRSAVSTMAPHLSASAYQNYIDPGLADWENAYYGANLPRLRSVKRQYDPDEVFRFPQSIRPH